MQVLRARRPFSCPRLGRRSVADTSMLYLRYVNGVQRDLEQTFATTAFIALAIQLVVAQLQQVGASSCPSADPDSCCPHLCAWNT